jgi:flagellar export protein FliJ
MKKFVFRLHSVRAHKARLEEEAAGQVSAALRKVLEASAAVRMVQEQIRSAAELHPRRETPAHELLQLSEYHKRLRSKLEEAQLREKAAENNLARARESWAMARQQKEVLEALHQREKAGHEEARRNEEQKGLDEVSRRSVGTMSI